jgi:hypothetical protein
MAIPVGSGAVGVSVTALTTEDMLITTPEAPTGLGETFNAASMVVGLSYGYRLTDRFSIGASFKYISERIMNSSATGMAVDIGTVYDTPFRGIKLGVSISNFGTKMRMNGEDLNLRVDIAPDQEGNNQSVVGQFRTDEFDLPLIMRVGISWDVFTYAGQKLTIEADGVNPNDNAQSVNIGGEFSLLNDIIRIRGGFNELFLADREKGFTFGGGLNLHVPNGPKLFAGYAYQDMKHLAGVNRFTMTVMF